MPPGEPSQPVSTGRALREAKFALRARCLARRDALPERVHAAASAAIVAGIAALACWKDAPSVLLTLPIRSEWNSRPLLEAALAAGKRVALPRVDARTRTLELHSIRDPDADVAPGYQRIPEPLPSCPGVAPGEVSWVLVPGVAFDARGARLGYGGGYYDRLLPLLRSGVPRVAGAFELQLLDAVPLAGHDARIDRLVTEARTIHCVRAVDGRPA